MKRHLILLTIIGAHAFAQAPLDSTNADAFRKRAEEMRAAADAAWERDLLAKWPEWTADRAIDTWLREKSPYYKSMADNVGGSGGYEFRVTNREIPWLAIEAGIRYIELPDKLRGPERVSQIIAAIGNLLQYPKHAEIDEEVKAGKIDSAAEFAILHELVEFDGLRLHRQVLEEIAKDLGGVPKEMYRWINARSAGGLIYEIPMLYDFIKTCEASGRFARYKERFEELKNSK